MSTPEENINQSETQVPAEGVNPEAGEEAAPEISAEAVEAAADEAGEGAEPTAEDLATEVEGLKNLVARQQEDVLRAQAEVDNIRKRSQREVENAHKFGLEKIMNELLPVRDSLELGLGAASDEGVEVSSVREGLELTLKMLNTATEKFGLVEVNPLDEAFDPDKHQAISMQPVEGKESGTVINVVQKGFVLNDRLVRPAMVIVAQ